MTKGDATHLETGEDMLDRERRGCVGIVAALCAATSLQRLLARAGAGVVRMVVVGLLRRVRARLRESAAARDPCSSWARLLLL